MTQPEIQLAFFVLNWILIIGDASLGYFVLPMILPSKPDVVDEDEAETGEATIGGMRSLLTVMVLLYMLVNCYAYFRQYSLLLYLVTALVGLDIIIQLVLRRRRVRQG